MPNTNILIRLHLFVSVSSLGYYFHFHFHVHPFILFVCRDDTIIHQKRARGMSIHQQWRIDNHQCGAGGYYLKRDRPEMKRARKRVRERASEESEEESAGESKSNNRWASSYEATYVDFIQNFKRFFLHNFSEHGMLPIQRIQVLCQRDEKLRPFKKTGK